MNEAKLSKTWGASFRSEFESEVNLLLPLTAQFVRALSEMQVTISEKQLGVFFALLGIGVIVTSSLVLDENSKDRARLIACVAIALTVGLAQMVISLLLFFKDEYKRHWFYAHAIIFVVYIIVFAIPLSDGYNKRCGSNMDAYFAVVGVDLILTFGGLILMRGVGALK